MTPNARPLTDDLLRRALAELAGGPDADVLLAAVLRDVDATAQVARRPWDTRRWGRTGLLLVAALLLLGAIGTAVALWSPRPQPAPLPGPPSAVIDVPSFEQPFTYRIPAGATVQLAPRGPAPPSAVLAANDGGRMLEVFVIGGYVHACGEEMTILEPPPIDPERYMSGLGDRLGTGIGPLRTTTLGNLPAVAAEIDPTDSACPEYVFHQSGLGWDGRDEPRLPQRLSTLIVGRASYAMIGVLISAPTEDEYAAWLPTAMAYVDSFVFADGRPRDWPAVSPAAR